MRKSIVGISLKNYQNYITEACEFSKEVVKEIGNENQVEQFMFPSLGVIYPVSIELMDSSIGLGAQNIGFEANGAFTGEFSVESLIDMGGKYVEIGHIERRTIFKESNDIINKKLKLALRNGVTPVHCIGELEITEDYCLIKQVLKKQLSLDLATIDREDVKKIIFAYEPAWAIGKAQAASSTHVHKVHHLIRKCIEELYDKKTSDTIRIIYGGSVSLENVEEIVSDDNVDGVFVGRFGHNPKNYALIVKLVKKIKG
ncbi:triose-phosphate isomerase family protein [Vagococcus xieshaowenii]|uniref:Triosephosphate isomerase n=1 Tax=Vagococcus xieshaowenii TaxID=2562451 RepID=A0AAJ5EER6_9ENTE|nr:triose-phosphate isomerase family protein [Vagococcus xieshaowenii]QCA29423.1 triosephosphate isomerase [Vagococcus xieshaowenii]TFZ41564.1 triosephosphate isomerase [Vagococcus xieshaowenii]